MRRITRPESTKPSSQGSHLLLIATAVVGLMSLQSCELFQLTIQTPSISPNGGSLGVADTISLSCTTDGVDIYYTLDGSSPSLTNGTRYAAPFTLRRTGATLKAKAFRTNYNDSAEASADFTLNIADSTTTTVIDGSNPATFLASGVHQLQFNLASNQSAHLVFTNGSTTSATGEVAALSAVDFSPRTQTAVTRPLRDTSSRRGIRDFPGQNEANEALRQEMASRPRASSRNYSATDYSVGESYSFKDYNDSSVAVTLRYKSSSITTNNGSRYLRIWVADNCWTGSTTKAYQVTNAMLTPLAAAFLQSGLDNDIYDWDTSLLGNEWDGGVAGMIGTTPYLDIVIFDIDNDNAEDGGVLGYFYSRDNYLDSTYPTSNEMLGFAIDAVMYANPSDYAAPPRTSWSFTQSYWPPEMVSTLAHEFQHMINFNLNRDDSGIEGTSSIWVNELMSMVVEDLVADKILVNGPRGVTYNDYSAGDEGNPAGRLPDFILYPDISVVNWGETDTLASYGMGYTIGAWLMRNFGGPALLQDINNQTTLDAAAVCAAVNDWRSANGDSSGAWDFGGLLARFGAAVLLSTSTSTSTPLVFNSGASGSTPNWTFSASASGGTGSSYNLGDINVQNYYYNYYSVTQDGLYESNGDTLYRDGSLAAGANSYYSLGSGIANGSTYLFYLPEGTRLTVVVK